MAENKITRIQLKRDSAAKWLTASAFTPKEGEPLVYTDTFQFKIGNGKKTVSQLPFLNHFTNGENPTALTKIGTGAQSYADHAIAFGQNSVAGCMGIYIREMYLSPSMVKIALSTTQPGINGQYGQIVLTKNSTKALHSESIGIDVSSWGGKDISLCMGTHIAFLGKVESVTGNILTLVKPAAVGNREWNLEEYIVSILSSNAQATNNPFQVPTDSANGYFSVKINNENQLDSDEFIVYCPQAASVGLIQMGQYATASGRQTIAAGVFSNARGRQTIAFEGYGEASGRNTQAGYAAHSQNQDTRAIGINSDASGLGCIAIGDNSRAAGIYSVAHAFCSVAEGQQVEAHVGYQHVIGKWNARNDNALFIIGDGTSVKGHNIFEVGDIKDNGEITDKYMLLGSEIVTSTEFKNMKTLCNSAVVDPESTTSKMLVWSPSSKTWGTVEVD